MDQLNYHHLLYFWTVAREGGIQPACDRLHLAQPTISGQIKRLERALGLRLFRRSGRRLVLTDVGRVVYRYADDIFTLGEELIDTVSGRLSGKPQHFTVGIADVLPKLVAFRLIEPALRMSDPINIICREGKPNDLMAALSVHHVDLVLADAPTSPQVHVRAFNHLLGECGVTVFGTDELAKRFRRGFPRSLHTAPFLMPTDNTALRLALEHWLVTNDLRPAVAGEFEDSALLKVFGQAGMGLFVAPSVVEEEVCAQYGVRVVGRLDDVRERFYAISVERRIKHPAVVAIASAARDETFR
jgi:LysR family transcriptional activator of nhaA